MSVIGTIVWWETISKLKIKDLFLLTPRYHITRYYRQKSVCLRPWFPKCAPRIPRNPRPV